jgi:hypothetical protein
MSYTLTYQLSPERTRGLHGSPMNRPQAVNWANRTAAASPRSLRCAAIRAAPIASGTFPLHALRFGLQAPVSAQRRVRKVPPQAVRNLPHQKTSIHHATTLNVRDASLSLASCRFHARLCTRANPLCSPLPRGRYAPAGDIAVLQKHCTPGTISRNHARPRGWWIFGNSKATQTRFM